jgi:hypothetical protein
MDTSNLAKRHNTTTQLREERRYCTVRQKRKEETRETICACPEGRYRPGM